MNVLFMQTACRVCLLQVINFAKVSPICFIKSKMQLYLGILLWAFTLGPDKLYPGNKPENEWYKVTPDDSLFLLVSPKPQFI